MKWMSRFFKTKSIETSELEARLNLLEQEIYTLKIQNRRLNFCVDLLISGQNQNLKRDTDLAA